MSGFHILDLNTRSFDIRVYVSFVVSLGFTQAASLMRLHPVQAQKTQREHEYGVPK